jgi:hypothetical protein
MSKKKVPAVVFQEKLAPAPAPARPRLPARLELYQDELARTVGGLPPIKGLITYAGGQPSDTTD